MIMKLNMNINTSVAAIYAMMLLLVACSQERTLFPTEKTDRVPLSVFTSFKADVTTRATAQPLPEGSSIGVFLIADANYTPQSNVKYTCQPDDEWTSETSVCVGGARAGLCAYYPFGKVTFSADTRTTLKNQAYTEDADWWYAKDNAAVTVTNLSPEIEFLLEKPYSQLSLEMIRNGRYPLQCKITNVRIELENGESMVDTGTFDIKDGNLQNTPDVTSYSYPTSGPMHDTGLGVGEAARDTTCNYLFVPQTLASGLKLTLTIDEREFSVIVPQTDLGELIAGKRHVVRLDIRGGIPINIVEVTTKEWQSTSLDGGDATTIKDTTEIIIDGGKVGTEDWASDPTENGSGALYFNIKRMKTNLLFFICILFALVSCEQEDKVSGEKTLAVVSASSDDRPSTRGIINDNTYALGVFRTTANTYAPLYNVKHIYSGGEWGADDVIKVDYRNASFFAYYPYHTATGNYAGLAGGTTLTLQAQLFNAGEDICYGAGEASGGGPVSVYNPFVEFLNMKHAYARLRLTLTRGEKFDKTKKCNIQNITFKSNNANFYLTRSLDIASTAGATGGSAVAAGYVHNPNVNIATGKSVTYEYMFPPQPLAGSKLTILVTVDGVTRSCDISTLGSSLDSGKYYGVSLTFTDVGIILSSAVVTVNNFGGQGNTQVDTEL